MFSPAQTSMSLATEDWHRMHAYGPYEQGGCCVVRTYADYVVPSPMVFTAGVPKQHTVSRYRAIAPKPIAPKPPVTSVELPASSEATFDSRSTVSSEKGSRFVQKKGRKRSSSQSVPASSPKRPRVGVARLANSPMAARDARYGFTHNTGHSSLLQKELEVGVNSFGAARPIARGLVHSRVSMLPKLLPKEPMSSSSSSSVHSGICSPDGMRAPNAATASTYSTVSEGAAVRTPPLLPKLDTPAASCSTVTTASPTESGAAAQLSSGPPADTNYLEQVYGSSQEAVMLTDDQNRLLWSNSAFKKEAADSLFGDSGLLEGDSPDQLAFPVPVSSVLFHAPFQSKPVSSVLWIFLRKTPSLKESTREKTPESVLEIGTGASTSPLEACPKVLAPQPVRPVGSVVSFCKLRAAGQGALGLQGSFEVVQRQFDRWETPVILTDLRRRVGWVNKSFKKLVGQPECPWMMTAVGSLGEDGSHVRLTGGVSVLGLQDLQSLPASVVCDAKVQWAGRCVDALCSGTRVDSTSTGVLGYVWCLEARSSS